MMTGLMEILTTKLSKVNELYTNMIKIEKDLEKLDEEERKSLPKFKGKLDEKSLNRYFEELAQSVKNPIRFKRKRTLLELGIASIENVKDEVFDDDNIEKTIQLLREFKLYDRLFKILSPEIPSLLLQDSISNVNSQLEDIKNNIESLKKIEDIRSEDVKDYALRKYINRELNIYQINEINKKVREIEEMLDLSIKKEEISLIDEVYKLINDVKDYGKEFEEQCSNLNDAKDYIEKFISELRQKYELVKDEINFWRELCPEVYVPETKNISTLINKLKELKERSKKEHVSFDILEQIYNQKLRETVENLKEFAHQLDVVSSHLSNLKIVNKDDLDTVKEVYTQLSWLKEIEYPNAGQLFEGLAFENVKEFLQTVIQIRKEYEGLKEDLKVYQRILEIEEEQIDRYPLLKQKIDEYKNELQNRIGEGFESLIKFLRGETEDIEVDEETLKNFIKTVKPFLKEALKI